MIDPFRQLPSDLFACSDRKSVWVLGGDGWAYDIGTGALRRRFATCPPKQVSSAHLKENYALLKKLSEM